MKPVQARVLISGQVQGVSFRFFTKQLADSLSVTGWVRNRRDGSVEAMIQGAPEALGAMIEWVRTGPELARVDRVEISAGSGWRMRSKSR